MANRTRQAGAEVTDEMLKAGCNALLDGTAMFTVWRLSESEQSELVKSIYLEMVSKSSRN